MASMEDLIATISGGMHVGQQANDLKDLQAKLSQTLNPTIPTYRPVPPSNTYNNTNAAVPPAPASSWNSPPPTNSFLSSSPYAARQMAYPSNSNGNGNARRDVGFSITEAAERASSQTQGRRDYNDNTSNGSNLNINNTNGGGNGNGNGSGQDRPYHAEVLPERASPAKTDGFADDAFKPIWERDQTKSNGAFTKSR